MNIKKLFLFSILTLISTISFSQIGPPSTPSPYSTMVQNPPLGITTWRTITPNPIYDVIIAKGTESWTHNAHSLIFPNYAGPRADGNPERLLYIDPSTGAMKVSGSYALDSRYSLLTTMMDSLSAVRGTLNSKIDWNDTVQFGPIMTKDAAMSAINNIDNSIDSVASLLTNYYTKSQSDLRYLQSFTETDPIFSASPSFGISSGNISNWNTVNSKLNSSDTSSLSNRINLKLSIAAAAATYQTIIAAGTVSQYRRGDNTWQTLDKNVVGLGNVDNTSDANKNVLSSTKLTTVRTINGQSFDGTSNITIPGSAITNIPNASLSNSSITINGNSVSLGSSTTVTASPSVGAPTSGTAITMGTAFQPRAGGPCFLAISGSLTGALGLNETITIAMSSTSGGTYTTVATDQLLIGLLGLTLDRCVGTIPVPAGWWVKVTRSGSAASATYTKWDL